MEDQTMVAEIIILAGFFVPPIVVAVTAFAVDRFVESALK
jgi:hypothetical protein